MSGSFQLSRGTLLLQSSIIFLSTTGVLGRYMSIDPNWIIYLRALLSCVLLLVGCLIWQKHLKLPSYRVFFWILLSAAFMAGHWLSYFQALSMAEVAIVMLALFSYPAMTALLEPLIQGHGLHWQTIGIAILVTVGIGIMSYGTQMSPSTQSAIMLGLVSALCYTLRNITLKRINQQVDSTAIMMYQTGLVAVLLLPMLGWIDTSTPSDQYLPLLLLCLVPTALGHTLFVYSMKYMTVAKASIISSLTPIYGAIWAFAILHEAPAISTYIGGLIIVLSVVLAGRLKNKYQA